nr:TPM domain-containing protein [Sinimarinibacterium sp. CAU 1509]
MLARIEAGVKACEQRHAGEIRVAVEAALPLDALLQRRSARERALDVFSQLRVWDTEHNNGVLIYVLLADRDVEIVADRGVAGGRVAASEWEACCRVIEAHFRDGHYADGMIAGVEAVAAVLARHPPDAADVGNELPDAPALL